MCVSVYICSPENLFFREAELKLYAYTLDIFNAVHSESIIHIDLLYF